MKPTLPSRPPTAHRHFIATIALAVGLLLAGIAPATVSATALQSARGNPIVTLSNGATVHVTVNVSSDAANVRQIVYTVRVPRGTTVERIVYTGGLLLGKEVVRVYPDLSAGQYSTDTLVLRQSKSVQVEAQTRVVAGALLTKTVYGRTGQHLVVNCTKSACTGLVMTTTP